MEIQQTGVLPSWIFPASVHFCKIIYVLYDSVSVSGINPACFISIAVNKKGA